MGKRDECSILAGDFDISSSNWQNKRAENQWAHIYPKQINEL